MAGARSWLFRGAGIAGKVVLVLLLLAALLPVLLLFALRFEVVRSRVAAAVDSALSSTFRGRVRLGAVEWVDLSRVVADGSIEDDRGRTVVRFQGLEARVLWPKLVVRVLTGEAPLRIEIDEVDLAHAEVRLIDDGTGLPTLASVFDPRTPSTSPSTGPGPIVSLGRIRVKHVWAHGALAGAPPLDAELTDLELSLRVDDRALVLPVERAAIVARSLPYELEPRGSLRGRLRVPFGRAEPEVEASYRGVVAGTQLTATFSLVDSRLAARVEAPAVDQATLARFAPELELVGAARLTANATGTLSAIRFEAEVSGEVGELRASGLLRTEESTLLSAELRADNIDLARLVRDAPVSELDVSARVDGKLAAGVVEASYDVRSSAGTLAGQALPALATNGKLVSAPETFTVAGELEIEEPGAGTRAAYELRFAGANGALEVRSTTELREPKRLKLLAGVRTSGRLTSALRLKLPEQTLGGRVEAALENVAVQAAAIGKTALAVDVAGTLDDPRFSVVLDAADVRARGRAFARARIRAQGTPSRMRIAGRLDGGRPDELRFETTLVLGERTELLGAELALVDREGPLQVSAQRVAFASGFLALSDLVVSGAGRAEVSFEQRGRALHAKARALDLDLGRLSRLAGLELPIKSARTTLDLRYDSDRTATSGFVVGRVEDVAYANVKRAHADIDLRLAEQRLTGTVAAALAPGARVVLALDDVVVEGSPFQLPPPEQLVGRLALHGSVDLQGISPLLAQFERIPLGDARGRLTADISYERRADALPSFEAHVRTSDLELAGRLERKEPIRTTDEAIAASTWNLRDVDVDFDLTLDSSTRRMTLTGSGHDKHGILARVDATASELPAVRSIQAMVRAWQEVPLAVTLEVPSRKLRHLPQFARPDGMNGTLELEAALQGTAKRPELRVRGSLGRLRAAGGREPGEPPDRLDVEFQAEYAREAGKFAVRARRELTPVAELSGSWDGDILKFDPARSADGDFGLRAEAKFDGFELETVSALKNRQIGGRLRGDARIEYGKGRRQLAVDVNATQLTLGQVVLDSVRAGVVAREGELRGDVTIRGKAGSLDAAVRSGLAWRGRLAPELRGDIDATLEARAFRLGALWPLSSAALSELDGRLDAKLNARVRDGRLRLSGEGKLYEGVIQIPALGQRLDRIQAKIEVQPEEIRLRDVRAHGVSGALSATSVFFLDEQLSLREAKATVRIKKNERIPITTEGVTIGDAWGNLEAHFVRQPEQDKVEVKLSDMHLIVPDVDQHDVQSLEAAEGVRIGARQKDEKFVALPVQPLEQGNAGGTIRPMVVNVDLGKAFSVERGDDVSVLLTGKLEARVAEETSVVGRIQLAGGTLDVSGKRFEIESGTVTFSGGDPSNPTVTAIARWDSPAEYSVYAEYVGTAKNGHLRLRAEPPLTEDQIVTLLLFGTPDGSYAGDSSGGASDTAAGAVGLAGSTAARGLNRALSKFSKLDVQARVDTSTGSARPEIVVGLSPRLSARVTRAIGEPTAGTSPDRTFLTLELRLKRNWALSALVGDRGASALDLIWRHRY